MGGRQIGKVVFGPGREVKENPPLVGGVPVSDNQLCLAQTIGELHGAAVTDIETFR
jgi:hypothetical protein